MNHESNIRLVYAHTERDGGHDDSHLITKPSFMHSATVGAVHVGVIGQRTHTSTTQILGYLWKNEGICLEIQS